jgi:predicted secreted hydrolase
VNRARINRRALLLALGGFGFASFAEAQGVHPRMLRFPADHGAHPDTRTEWWYVTGTLETDEALHGFQITFFRSRTGIPTNHPSRFAASQLVFAHAAVSDLKQGRLRHDQRIARAGFGIAQAAEGDTAVSLRDWRLWREAAKANPTQSLYHAQVSSDIGGFRFDLSLTTQQALLLQGEAGYSRKGPGANDASHYYSQPQLAVAGTLTLDGRPAPVRGTAWLDHEWSDSLLPAGAVGWDWIGMNLDDGSALMAFRLRRADGSAVYAGGSFRAPGQATQNFAADAVRFKPQRQWTSASSRATYPVEWTLETPAGNFRVKSLLDNQELDSRSSTGAVYWEGLSELLDERGQRVGRGYLEMTGYAGTLKLS